MTGLSPRVRGNRVKDVPAVWRPGTIPACAGEPTPGPWFVPRYRDYPRVCGGTFNISHIAFSLQGLSPRVRGNLVSALKIDTISGTIPACAGEPRSTSLVNDRNRDYPRVCGGTVQCASATIRRSGLSPRVRGNQITSIICPLAVGTIPACAGEPTLCLPVCPVGEDYPRVCGGTIYCDFLYTPKLGLSPRVRGNHHALSRRDQRLGTIPACAGEPSMKSTSGSINGDYPRVCGGTLGDLLLPLPVQGLSPRVRGNLNNL